jgi:hypothetical protein
MTPQLAYFIAWERGFRASLFELRQRQHAHQLCAGASLAYVARSNEVMSTESVMPCASEYVAFVRDCRDKGISKIWKVCACPSDYPCGYVARLSLIGKGKAGLTKWMIPGDTLDGMRDELYCATHNSLTPPAL